jgi:hypothetical protein
VKSNKWMVFLYLILVFYLLICLYQVMFCGHGVGFFCIPKDTLIDYWMTGNMLKTSNRVVSAIVLAAISTLLISLSTNLKRPKV